MHLPMKRTLFRPGWMKHNSTALKLAVDTYRTEMDSLNAVIKELEKELEAKHKPDLAALDSVLSDAINHFTADDGWRGWRRRSTASALQQKLHRTHEKADRWRSGMR